MRAARCHTLGGPPVVEEVPEPRGEVPVDVHFAAVNFADVLVIEGTYQVKAEVPFIPGSEFSGTVARDGHGFRVGDRVFGSAFIGAFAERVAVSAASLHRIPAAVPMEGAAAFGVSHATAFNALRLVADVREGERVTVLGAAGAVGLAAVELALLLGAEVIAVASSEEKRAVCAELGAHTVLPYEHLKRALQEAGGADVVVDPVGGPHSEQALRGMRWGGRFVSVGFASGEIPSIPLNLAMLKGVTIHGFDFGGWARHDRERLAAARIELHRLFAEGAVHPRIHAVHPLDEVGAALRVGRGAIGKVLLEVARGV
ncbi:NADPH:quinone oxidoreductase family protein [Streptomyces sp. NBC_00459]|uniref:NADPH:quinone oxidoreductase family protein n=1 Tax=Streptomyces sp. NBC_00459 TaxID=2975749 RepID=UPI002E188B0B